MSNRYLGGFLTNTATQPTSNVAIGVWTLTQQAQAAQASIWPLITFNGSYLVVAGGGGGGNAVAGVDNGGGGGAGGYQVGTTSFTTGSSYTVTVGSGGASRLQGNNSQLGSITASVGGGLGGTRNISAGGNGGSGGGGAGTSTYVSGGSGTSGQGNAGGTGSGSWGAGGGGAGAVGGNGTTGGPPGSGGVGLSSSITGSAVFYAGGGGGSGSGTTFPNGGNGGGGTGNQLNNPGTAGTANTGGGGGGGSGSGGASPAGGAGGSGVVIISVPTARAASSTTGSPTITTNGSNTIYKFTSSGTITF